MDMMNYLLLIMLNSSHTKKVEEKPKEEIKLDTSKVEVKKVETKKEDIIKAYQEIKRDLKNYELEKRIEELEAKFSKDFNESTFNELKELKKLQKTN